MQDVRGAQQGPDQLLDLDQRGSGITQHLTHPAHRRARTREIGDEFNDTGDRDVPEHQRIHHPSPQVRPIRSGRVGYSHGRGRGGDLPAATTPLVQPVFGDRGHRRRDISDVAAHHTRRCRIVQTGTAAPATVGNIIEHLVRVIDQLQRKPLRTRLLPRLATGLAAQRPRRRGLFRSVRGWWLRRVPAVLPHLPPQLGNLTPAAHRPSPGAPRSPRQSPHRTDVDRQTPHNDQQIRDRDQLATP